MFYLLVFPALGHSVLSKDAAVEICIVRGFTKFSIKVALSLQFLGYLRALSLKFQKAQTKIGDFLPLPNWLSQLN